MGRPPRGAALQVSSPVLLSVRSQWGTGSRATCTGLGREEVDQECPEWQPRGAMARPGGHGHQLLNLKSHILLKREKYLKSALLSKTLERANLALPRETTPHKRRAAGLVWRSRERNRWQKSAEATLSLRMAPRCALTCKRVGVKSMPRQNSI